MLKKILAAVLVAAASCSFMPTSEAADVDYTCRGGYYNDGYCYGNDYYSDENRNNYGRHHRGGCWR